MSERHRYQAEIQQLLDIVIHSLYTDRDIFVRELVSNAADACEKLRFLQSSGTAPFQPETALAISVKTDDKANTITITDTGIGMTNGDLVENLGTIAHSGTKAFLKQLAETQKPDARLIGQFGVGFYSAFMVAAKVTVLSRSHKPDEQGWRWTSENAGGYEIEPAADLPRGTQVIVQLKDDAKDFAQEAHVKRIVQRYSSFIQFPIELNGTRLNTIQAIWSRSKNEITDADYNSFYQYVGHDHEDPLLRLHFTADAPLAIQALVFVPKSNWENMGLGRTEPGVNLYCKKVLIQDHAKNLFPEWLRFLKGVVDSEDLPLNISRETMQDTALLKKLNQVLTGRFLKFLDETAEKDAALYEKFYAEYARCLKEGVATDFAHREALGKLLRYESSTTEKGKLTSLADYVKRMPSDQKEIFYLLAPNREAAEGSPYYEVFQSRGYEVLFLQDPWDEFVMEHLHEFDKKPLRAAEKAELDVTTPPAVEGALSDADAESLAKWLKEKLADRVGAVRASKRLVNSPAVVVDADRMMTSSMRRILKAVQKDKEAGPEARQDLEINLRHAIIVRLAKMRETDEPLAVKVAEQVLDNARVAAGLLDDPRAMLKRLNELLEQVLTVKG
ncbi:MAG: molecular chaperone HtpG [Verrucomicrobia bacterium]|nr:molecular chaperone HtpG [Verrucomicrobiota bacterium]